VQIQLFFLQAGQKPSPTTISILPTVCRFPEPASEPFGSSERITSPTFIQPMRETYMFTKRPTGALRTTSSRRCGLVGRSRAVWSTTSAAKRIIATQKKRSGQLELNSELRQGLNLKYRNIYLPSLFINKCLAPYLLMTVLIPNP
jgi:hypothetical protein